jgi:hypothetical protein
MNRRQFDEAEGRYAALEADILITTAAPDASAARPFHG